LLSGTPRRPPPQRRELGRDNRSNEAKPRSIPCRWQTMWVGHPSWLSCFSAGSRSPLRWGRSWVAESLSVPAATSA